MQISKNMDIDVNLTVDDMVTLIWDMDTREQAELLLKLNELKEKNYPLVSLQMAGICDEVEKLGVKEEVHSFIEELADFLEG